MFTDFWETTGIELLLPIGWTRIAMSEIWYDNEEDVLGIQVTSKKYWKSIEVSKNVVVDLAEDGDIIGVEIFHAKQHLKKDAPLIVARASSRSKK